MCYHAFCCLLLSQSTCISPVTSGGPVIDQTPTRSTVVVFLLNLDPSNLQSNPASIILKILRFETGERSVPFHRHENSISTDKNIFDTASCSYFISFRLRSLRWTKVQRRKSVAPSWPCISQSSSGPSLSPPRTDICTRCQEIRYGYPSPNTKHPTAVELVYGYCDVSCYPRSP